MPIQPWQGCWVGLNGIGLLLPLGSPMAWSDYAGLLVELAYDEAGFSGTGRFCLAPAVADGSGPAWPTSHFGAHGGSARRRRSAVLTTGSTFTATPLTGAGGRCRTYFPFSSVGVIGAIPTIYDPSGLYSRGSQQLALQSAAWTDLWVGLLVEDNSAIARTFSQVTCDVALVPRR